MRIAVTGASGTLGRHVVELLAADNDHEVLAVSRRPSSDGPPRVLRAQADYSDRAALRRAFDGIDTLVFVSSDGEAANVLYHHHNVIHAAAAAGVGHIVAMSGLDADTTSPFCYAVTYGHTEQMLQQSGCTVTIARTSIFAEFFLQFLRTARERGEIRLPAHDGRVSLVSITDIGRCLAELALRGPVGGIQELTGPAALDMHDIAADAARIWHTRISYVDLTPSDFQRELATAELDPWWCYAFSSMFTSIRQHRWERVTEQVHQLTDRQPLAFSDVLDG